jgi:hypothetical protein
MNESGPGVASGSTGTLVLWQKFFDQSGNRPIESIVQSPIRAIFAPL